MSSIGTVCRQAREAKGMSIVDAATETHIKSQYLAAIESDDFSCMPAALYAKGFVKIYAEYLGLDPAPLLQQFAELATVTRRPGGPAPANPVPPQISRLEQDAVPPLSAPVPPAPIQKIPGAAPAPAPKPAAPPVAVPFERVPETPPPIPQDSDSREQLWDRAGDAPDHLFSPDLVKAIWRYLPIGVGALVVIVLLLSGMNHCARNRHAAEPVIAPAVTVPVTVKQPTAPRGPLRLGQEPPAPYMDERR